MGYSPKCKIVSLMFKSVFNMYECEILPSRRHSMDRNFKVKKVGFSYFITDDGASVLQSILRTSIVKVGL